MIEDVRPGARGIQHAFAPAGMYGDPAAKAVGLPDHGRRFILREGCIQATRIAALYPVHRDLDDIDAILCLLTDGLDRLGKGCDQPAGRTWRAADP